MHRVVQVALLSSVYSLRTVHFPWTTMEQLSLQIHTAGTALPTSFTQNPLPELVFHIPSKRYPFRLNGGKEIEVTLSFFSQTGMETTSPWQRRITFCSSSSSCILNSRRTRSILQENRMKMSFCCLVLPSFWIDCCLDMVGITFHNSPGPFSMAMRWALDFVLFIA